MFGSADDMIASLDTIINSVIPSGSMGQMVVYIGLCITAVIGFVFLWWGVRKLVGMVMAAFRKGRLSV